MLYIVTPVYNRREFTRNYLQALSHQTTSDFKIIIVDDGSTDGTARMIEHEFPEVILLKERGELWWAEATNIGVRHAIKHGATYIMTLNDDTIPEPDYIEKMLYWSRKYPDALLGALALDVETGKIIFGGVQRDWKTGRIDSLHTTIPSEKQHGLHKVDHFPGRGLLIPVPVFNTIGFYDSKNFPQTVADLDFTYRASRNGFDIYCNYDAKIRIFAHESAAVKIRKNKSMKNYFNHLFSLRGGGNLRYFTIFSIKNCPRKYLPQFLAIGLARRMVGYFLK